MSKPCSQPGRLHPALGCAALSIRRVAEEAGVKPGDGSPPLRQQGRHVARALQRHDEQTLSALNLTRQAMATRVNLKAREGRQGHTF